MQTDIHTCCVYVTYILYTDKKPGHMDRFEQEILESGMCGDRGEGRGKGGEWAELLIIKQVY